MSKSTEIVQIEPVPELTAPSVPQLMELAKGGIDVDVIERLLAMSERAQEKQARLAFHNAIAAFQDECPTIPKKKGVRLERNSSRVSYYYAPLPDIERVVRPYLFKHGLSYTWDTSFENNVFAAHCRVMHVDGHMEVSTFSSAVDKQAKMNTVQSTASTGTYCRRHSLVAALGISTADTDDDARLASGEESVPDEEITTEQLADLKSTIEEIGADHGSFCKFLRVEMLGDLRQSRLQDAVDALATKRAEKERTK